MLPETHHDRRLGAAWHRLRRDEEGVALVLAILTMLVLTISLTTVIFVTASGARDAHRTNAGQKAYALAESGVNNALAVLNASYPDSTNPPPGNRCLLRPQPVPPGFPGTALFTDERAGCAALAGEDPITQYKPYSSTPDLSRPLESVEWSGRIRWVDGMGATWIIVSRGSVPNPAGGANVVRQITAKVPIVSGTPEESDPGILNWVYSPTETVFGQTVNLTSPLYVRGNLTVGNSSTVEAPLYVTCVTPPAPKPTQLAPCGAGAGNVRLENSAAILAPATLAIGGKLTLAGSGGAGIGTPLPSAHIVNGCPSAPCAWGAGTKVFAVSANRDYEMPDDPIGPPPTVDWPRWATYAAPGPMWGCDAATKAGTTPDFASAAAATATFSLIQPNAYTCRASIGTQTIGELSWDPTLGVTMGGSKSGRLTVSGTIYIPGNLDVTKPGGDDTFQYVGKGTIYVGGTISIKNVNLCATIAKYNAGSGNKWQCDTRPYPSTDPGAWDTKQNALILVAKGSGGALSAGNGIEVVSAQFQGVLAAEATVSVTTSSTVEGPMISIGSTVSLNQSTGAAFPEIRFPPASTPGKPPPPLVLLAPREFSGG
jgi:hypothetical protein